MDSKTLSGYAKCHANLALIKYWGKKDEGIMIPYTSSLSITLDKYYTETNVSFNSDYTNDIVYFNGNLIKDKNDQFYNRIARFMNYFRSRYNINLYAKIITNNYVPTKEGLASSASGFASLASACVNALNLNISSEELSQLARFGSISASRSVFPNIVLLDVKNSNNFGPYSVEYDRWDNLRVIVFKTGSTKKVSSREAMRKAVDNNYYNKWILKTNEDLNNIKLYISNKDFNKFGLTLQNNADLLHLLINKTNINYLNEKSIEVINLIKNMQNEVPIYYTMDAGSIIFGITLDKYLDQVLEIIKSKTDIEFEVSKVKTE